MNDLFVQGNPLVNVELPFASNLCSAFPLEIATKAFVVCIRKLALQRKTAFEESVSTSFLFALEVAVIFAICYFSMAIKSKQTQDANSMSRMLLEIDEISRSFWLPSLERANKLLAF